MGRGVRACSASLGVAYLLHAYFWFALSPIFELPQVSALVDDLPSAVREQGFVLLDLTSEDAHVAGTLQQPHRDPFDRLLAAQAKRRKLRLVTNDPLLARFDVATLW